MIRIGIFLCAVFFGATDSLHASEAIRVEKITAAQLQAAIRAASDDTVIEYQGQSKTKAQWRAAWQAANKPYDPAKQQQLAADRQVQFQTAAKALQDVQDQAVAKQNAEVDKDFNDLKSQQ